MTKRLTVQELEKKKRYHEKRIEYYQRKINAIEDAKNRIGFKIGVKAK